MIKIKGFTLIELLIVLAIVAVLATVSVIILNPSEIIKETRDSKRFEDLNHINIAVLEAESLNPNINLGIASSVYVSVPDSSATCANLGLSTSSLPSGWSYRCSSSANFRKTDGAGWIPVNFSSVSGGSVFASIPVDPINATSSGLYYTYTPGGSFQLSALFESFKYIDKATKDGGVDSAQYEVGDNLALAPFSHGLVGYWKFDETSGITAQDSSGFGNSGTLTDASSTNADGNTPPISTSTAKIGRALSFDGADDYVNNGTLNRIFQQLTVMAWIKTSAVASPYSRVVSAWTPGFILAVTFPGQVRIYLWDDAEDSITGITSVLDNNWHHIAATWIDDGIIKVYVDGNLDASKSGSSVNSIINTTAIQLQISTVVGDSPFSGTIDEVRIYNRVLSPSQIKAIYDATK
ncbi:MAG: LamG-like jellyroll fold domain-containing protein [Patescibacteria group bacterium]